MYGCVGGGGVWGGVGWCVDRGVLEQSRHHLCLGKIDSFIPKPHPCLVLSCRGPSELEYLKGELISIVFVLTAAVGFSWIWCLV